MRPFIHDDFLLTNEPARELYHNYAAKMPLIDYHCHLPPGDIAGNQQWENLYQLWLRGDHYKWRAMRSHGIDEEFITGSASDRSKFQKFAETMPYLLRNPLFDWSHLELQRYFGVADLLTLASAEQIWQHCNTLLQEDEYTARSLMQRSNVVLCCTTDDPSDTLEHHISLAKDDSFAIQVLPTWRPDKALAIDNPLAWNSWIDRLAGAANLSVDTWDDLLCALQKQHDFFASIGCKLSDYGVESVYAEPYTESEICTIFKAARSGARVTPEQVDKFRSALLYVAIVMDAQADWSVQIHYGAMRNNNTRMFNRLGADAGFDSIGDYHAAKPLSRLFDRLEQQDLLPRTVIYTLNPRDNEMLATMIGNFQRGPERGRMQFGSGWWFNDQRDGMLRQMEALSQLGLLSAFVGMLTDSRSFLSYTRHEYFRRTLCNMLGNDIVLGYIPNDLEWTGKIVEDICYNNAVRYFGFKLAT